MPMKSHTLHSFRDFFKQATGLKQGPHPYQERLAAEPTYIRLIRIFLRPEMAQ